MAVVAVIGAARAALVAGTLLTLLPRRRARSGQVKRAVLLAPTTATHAVNTSQRHLELRIKRRTGDTLTLQAPPTAAAAPPGYYMLFLLDAKGVPSVAQWIKLDAGVPAAPLR